jgi:hypothetical protein
MERFPALWWMFKTAFFKVMARLADPAVFAPFFMAVIAVYTAVNAKQQGETT